MLKIKLLTAVIALTVSAGNCQDKGSDKNEIHKCVIRELKKEGHKFNIQSATKKSIFSSFDFGGGGRGLDTTSNNIWNRKEWIDFVKTIDTASIREYALNSNAKITPAKNRLIFAPIIFSKENDKALCIGTLFSTTNGGGQTTAWYYQKENGIWALKASQIISLID
jgi:hypothetical protein